MMEFENKVHLTKKEFFDIYNKEVGHGTDGYVFKFNEKYLIKLYRTAFLEIKSDVDINSEEVKLATSKPNFVPIKGKLKFYIKEDDTRLQLRDEDAFKKIKEKQKRIIKTRLPQKLVYIDNKFVGVLLKKVHGIQIHKLTGMPLSYKKKIVIELLNSVQELLDNNVYHIDLANSPYSIASKKNDDAYEFGHSHVLVNPFTMKLNIIDLDGQSTIYTDHYNEELEENVFINLNTLILEFLFEIHFDENELEIQLDELNQEALGYELEHYGLSKEEIDSLVNTSIRSTEEYKQIVLKAKKR